jgi:uncharacterized protein
MPEYLAPGVYVEETSFKAPSIQSVATSTTGFVGLARSGPVDGPPELVTSFADYERVYGDLGDLDITRGAGVPATNYMAYAARAFFDEGGRRLYVARTYRPRVAGDTADGRAVGTILAGQAGLEARFPGTALNGWAIFRQRDLPSGASALQRAPIGTLVRSGGETPEGPAVLTGGAAPFALTDGGQLELVLPDGNRTITFQGSPAEVEGAAVADPGAISPAGNVLRVTIDGVAQEVRLPTGSVSLLDIANHINPRIRGGWVEVRNGDRLAFGTDRRGQAASIQVGRSAALGFPAASQAQGSGNVDRLDAVTAGEIDALLQGAGPAIPVRATLAPDGRMLRLATAATGAAATLAVTASPTQAALGLPTDAVTGTAGGTPHYYAKVVGGFQKANPGDPDLDPAAEGNAILLLDVEFQSAAGAPIAVLEGLGLHPDHPAAIHRALPEEPARQADALAYPYRLVIESGVDPFELREALFPAGPEVTVEIRGGHDGAEPGPADYAAGLARLGQIDDIAIIAAPGHSVLTTSTYQTVQNALAAHAQDSGFQIAVLDPERGLDLAGIRTTRGRIDNSYAALYWPWVIVANPLARPGREDIPREIALPPSGHVCGIYARNDVLRGVHKAPANEVVRQALRFEVEVPTGLQEVLNPIGVNCLRYLTGRGFRVWGARLASSDREVVYVSDRRYLNYLKRSIYVSMQWAVFEPNGPRLWSNVKDAVEGFLYVEWRNGALLGATPEQALFVRCDRSTMTQADLENGRLICEIGVALIKPAEFVIFRIGQKTADARG